MNPRSPSPPATGLVTSPVAERAAVLLTVAQAVAAHADLGALLRDLAAALGAHLHRGYLSFALLEPHSHAGKLQFLEPVGGARRPNRPTRPPNFRRPNHRPRTCGTRRSRSGST